MKFSLWSILFFEAKLLPQERVHQIGGIRMGKRNKSKRFVQQGKDTVSKHGERFPYRMTYAEAEAQKMANVHESSLGGI
jgi:hypothetical protein